MLHQGGSLSKVVPASRDGAMDAKVHTMIAADDENDPNNNLLQIGEIRLTDHHKGDDGEE